MQSSSTLVFARRRCALVGRPLRAPVVFGGGREAAVGAGAEGRVEVGVGEEGKVGVGTGREETGIVGGRVGLDEAMGVGTRDGGVEKLGGPFSEGVGGGGGHRAQLASIQWQMLCGLIGAPKPSIFVLSSGE